MAPTPDLCSLSASCFNTTLSLGYELEKRGQLGSGPKVGAEVVGAIGTAVFQYFAVKGGKALFGAAKKAFGG